ncbi:MAG: ROK family protein [Cellulomonas sp.]
MIPTATTGSGVLLAAIRGSSGATRSALGEQLGWSRMTVGKRLDELLTGGFILAQGQLDSTGGRRPDRFALNKDAGLLLAADVGSSHSRLGITDLASNVLVEAEVDIDLATGPERVLRWAQEVFTHLLGTIGRDKREVRAIGIGVPGPVDPHTGRLVNPPIMPGWDGVLVSDYFARQYDAVITVDRDVNLMVVGEHRIAWPERDNFVLVKLGLGLGLGFVVGGQLFRGALGAAGDLGHIRRGGTGLCRCGTIGCLEADASGWAIRRELTTLGYSIQTSLDIVALADSGNQDALRLLAEMGEQLGESLADMVGFLDPSIIVISGNLAAAGEPLLGAIRSSILRRVQPFHADSILITGSKLGVQAGVIGASLMAQDALFEPDRVSRSTKKGKN